MRRFFTILTLALALSVAMIARSSAQHTIAITGGTGFATARPYPAQEMKIMWGTYQAGFSWRYYSMPRILACFGIDVELLKRGFSFAPYPYLYEDKKDYKYYTRTLNSIVIPIVWQPHFYLIKNHLRIYLEAAPTFSFNFGSKFYNDERYSINIDGSVDAPISGKYEFRSERDNRFSYGLRGGLGFDLLFGQFEVGVRAMYDFGYSDILKNRNKYYSNSTDGRENPFYYSPLRSPIDNLSFSLTVGWRFNKRGFNEWFVVRPKKEKALDSFNFSEQIGQSGSGSSSGGSLRR